MAIQRKRKITPKTVGNAETVIPTKKSKPTKIPRLEVNVVSDIIIKNNIKNQKDLAFVAKQQVKEGKADLHKWMLSHNPRYRQDLINTTWLLETAESTMERSKKSRLDLLMEAKSRECSVDQQKGLKCEGTWLKAALEVLEYNNIDRLQFSNLIKNALIYGRGKGNNIMLVGPTNCAKSFLLAPLQEIYDCFSNPSNSAFNFVGALDKEVFFFNDLRYKANGVGDKEFLPWSQFLNLLEGAPMNVPMPKNHFSEDVLWTKQPPIFATSDEKICRITNGRLDKGETAQMNERWIYIELNYSFSGKCNYKLIKCGRCFAELILEAK